MMININSSTNSYKKLIKPMPKTDDSQLHEALELLNSPSSEVFVGELEQTIEQALIKAKAEKEALVESAITLTGSELKQLAQLLSSIFKKNLKLNLKIKPALIAGFRVSVGDWKLDATLLQQLNLLRENLGGRR